MVKEKSISEIISEVRMTHPDFIISSTPTLEGFRILDYLEPVLGCVSGTTSNFTDIKTKFAKMIGGGKTQDFEIAYKAMVNIAIKEAVDYALSIGANAIIDLQPAITEVGGSGSSLLIILHGTFVVVERLQDFPSQRVPRESVSDKLPVDKHEPDTAGPYRPDPHSSVDSAVSQQNTQEQKPPIKTPEVIESSYKASGVRSVKPEPEVGQHVTIGKEADGTVRFTPVRNK